MAAFDNLTPEKACRALAEAGFSHPAEMLQIAAREERWAVPLPDGKIAWFPASAAGSRRLEVERRVLRLLAGRCSFRVPTVLFVSNSGFDIRRMVPGRCDPWGLYRCCQRDTGLAQQIGRSIGAILAEQHTRIAEADVADWPRFIPGGLDADFCALRDCFVAQPVPGLRQAFAGVHPPYEFTAASSAAGSWS